MAEFAEFHVPFLTLEEAIEQAVDSDAEENIIYIDAAHISTSSHELGADFSADHTLTIRPGPGLKHGRAVIASTDGGNPIFRLTDAGYVTFQHLDIVRHAANFNDLMFLDLSKNITIKGCRIGSIWDNTGARGWSNLVVRDPVDVVVRNSIFFAYIPGTFDYGIRIIYTAPRVRSLLLYNNVVAHYKDFGIHAIGPDPLIISESDDLLLLRNNVVVNHPSADPEPVPYHSEVFDNMIVETSHNTAFVSLGDVETIDGDLGISGEADPDLHFLRRARAQLDGAFVQHTWVDNDLNLDFFRLVRGGPLHSEPADAGTNVSDHEPHERDEAVTDDFEEEDVRPGGILPHTDRGAYQIREADTLLGLGDLGDLGSLRPTP
jgi:hypothetical protein